MSCQSIPVLFSRQVVSRFWAKVEKKSASECWPWKASKRNKGYGAFCYTAFGRLVQDRAHRFSYMLHLGEIPENLFVLHKCDHPWCVNPDHLFIGTNLDNIKDMLSKGRHVKGGTHSRNGYRFGVNHPLSKLNPEIIKEIRTDREAGMSFGKIAKKHGISIGHADKIVKRKLWSHV